MTPPNEPFLKEFICEKCHAGVLEPHPEQKFSELNFYKCGICGFTKQVAATKAPHDKIIYGKDE